MISDLPCQGATDGRFLDDCSILDLADKRGVPRRQGCGLIDLQSGGGRHLGQRDALGHALCNPEREPFADMAAISCMSFDGLEIPKNPVTALRISSPIPMTASIACCRISRMPRLGQADVLPGLDQNRYPRD